MIKIFHLTDLHFGNPAAPFTPEDLQHAFQPFCPEFQLDTTYMIVTGDVTFRGQTNGYTEATDVIKNTWIQNGGNNSRFIACPGNHDICDNKFSAFDNFQYSIRRDHELRFEKANSHILKDENCVVVVINSAFHRNHEFGLVDVAQLELTLKQALLGNDERPRVAVIHHHVIGVDADDPSTIKNALPLLQILQDNRFELLIHGHRHALSQLVVGSHGMKVRAGRSLAFAQPGYVNGMTAHELMGGNWQSSHFFLSKDNLKPGKAVFAKQEPA